MDRGGKRAANAPHATSDVDERAPLPTQPFELITCDHYLVDLYCEVLDANGMTYAMQPWLTSLRDCYTVSRASKSWRLNKYISKTICGCTVYQAPIRCCNTCP
jgi:hypothetical protein